MLRRLGAFWTLADENAVPRITGYCYSERGVDMSYSSPFGRLGHTVIAWVGVVDWQTYMDGVDSWGLHNQTDC